MQLYCVPWNRYASGFRFAGDYVDTRCRDFIGRRETKIAAIDALCYSGEGQFKEQKLTRYAIYFMFLSQNVFTEKFSCSLFGLGSLWIFELIEHQFNFISIIVSSAIKYNHALTLKNR
jgi:hypothetical protein